MYTKNFENKQKQQQQKCLLFSFFSIEELIFHLYFAVLNEKQLGAIITDNELLVGNPSMRSEMMHFLFEREKVL